MSNQAKKQNAFTLIELLVVIAIIALLLSITMPALTKAKDRVKSVICRSNLKQWAYVFSLYGADNEDSFPQGYRSKDVTPEDAWILGATLPYYKNENLRMCPSTRPSQKEPYEYNHGETFLDWGPLGEASPQGNTWYDHLATGSYAFNEWCCDPPPYTGPGSLWGLSYDNVIRKITTEGASTIPLVADSVYVDTAVLDTDVPPTDNEHYTETYTSASWNHFAMKFYCIDRHSGGINASFVDMSARHIGLKQLWLFKWHMKFIKRSQPLGGWPNWMRKYKEY